MFLPTGGERRVLKLDVLKLEPGRARVERPSLCLKRRPRPGASGRKGRRDPAWFSAVYVLAYATDRGECRLAAHGAAYNVKGDGLKLELAKSLEYPVGDIPIHGPCP